MKRTIENYWVTPEEIIRADPCHPWTSDKIYAWFGKRKKVRLSTILFDRKIPIDDRAWIITDVIYCRRDIPISWWAYDVIHHRAHNLDKIILAIEW